MDQPMGECLPDTSNQSTFSLTALESALPSPIPPQRSPLLSLPAELRLQIYSLALDHPLSHQKVSLDGGRTRIRVTWPSAPYHSQSSTPAPLVLTSLLQVCQTTRTDLLRSFLSTTILKFPAWSPDFKLQCLYWIERASESFIRGLSWVWFEGVYWRFSIRFGAGEGEDEKATREDCHQYEETEWFEGKGKEFMLRVDFVRQMRLQARDAAGEVWSLLENLVGQENRLGKEDMCQVLRASKLTVGEQLKGSNQNYGVRTVYPLR